MKDIIIPQNSLRYILFQRTGYLRNNFMFKLLARFSHIDFFYKLSVDLKSLFFGAQIKNDFNKNMVEEYSIIRQFLPQNIDSILDIGCGVAGIDVLISNYYANKINVFLIDKTRIDKNVYYGFKQRGSFYNSLEIAKNLLETNGVPSDRIYIQEATDDNKITFENKFDVVISLISWGYHYPVATYLDQAYEKLKPLGILIIDTRKNTDGEKEINNKFGNREIIMESEKFARILARKI
jgi:SAM-dependent methyltransferase